MDFEELRTFIVLAECKSFTKTAEIQHIVQSTVSNRIHSLEEYTGAQLVIRDKAGIVLTTEGSVFLEYAKRIKELDNSALHEIHMLKNYNDRLNVGCAQWIFDYCAGDYIKIFSKTYDKIAINITIAHSEEIILLLQDQIYDVAVMGYKVKAANLVNCPFLVSDIIFVGAAEYYGHLHKGIKKRGLVDLPLIYSDIWENYLSEISENILSDKKIFKVHCNMLDVAKEFCIEGIGCCFFPEIAVRKEIESGLLIQIPIEDLQIKHFQVYMVYNKYRLDSAALKCWFHIFPDFKPI